MKRPLKENSIEELKVWLENAKRNNYYGDNDSWIREIEFEIQAKEKEARQKGERLELEATLLKQRVTNAANMAERCWNEDQMAAVDLGILPQKADEGIPDISKKDWLEFTAKKIMPRGWNWKILEFIESTEFVVLEYKEPTYAKKA